jgi:hypothetical protein
MSSFLCGPRNISQRFLVCKTALSSTAFCSAVGSTVKLDRVKKILSWIGLVNFAAGRTIVGWIAALVWSVTAKCEPAAVMPIGGTALRTAKPAAA